MGQYCFAGWRLSFFVTLPACWPPGASERGVGTLPAVGPAGRVAFGMPAAGRVGGRAADTARRTSTVTSH